MGLLATRRRNGLPSLWSRDPFTALREEMSDLRSQLMGENEGWFAGAMVPELDMSETDTSVEVRMDLPGITAKDIDIQVSGNTLTVTGERKEEKEEKDKTFHRGAPLRQLLSYGYTALQRDRKRSCRRISRRCPNDQAAQVGRGEGAQDQGERLSREHGRV